MPWLVKTLRHHKAIFLTALLEVAVAFALVTNASFLLVHHLERVNLPTGVSNKDKIITLQVSGVEGDGASPGQEASDLRALRGVPGVLDAASVNSLPLSGSIWSASVFRKSTDRKAEIRKVPLYVGTFNYARLLGLQLVEGRYFKPGEYGNYNPLQNDATPPAVAIVTRAMANRLWPGRTGVGEMLYLGDKRNPVRVVGVLSHLLSPNFTDPSGSELNILLPVVHVEDSTYILYTSSEDPSIIISHAKAALYGVGNNRMVLAAESYSNLVSAFFRADRSSIVVLLAVVCCLLALTVLGVIALSNLWVQQRVRYIGIRRALGATRADILRYFMAENFFVVLAGLLLGSAVALGLNGSLMRHFEAQRMPFSYYAVWIFSFMMLGQLAAFSPALRASKVTPLAAMRDL